MTSEHQQPEPIDAPATRDRLKRLLSLLGVRTQLQVVTYGPHKAVALSPLWEADADKLANALALLPELQSHTSTLEARES